MPKHFRVPVLVSLLAFGLFGCATTPKEAKADDGEYEMVTPTGSNIPVKVRKGQKAATISSPTDQMSADQLGTMRSSAGGAKPAGGN